MQQKTRIKLFGFKWYLQGSNQGHMDFQSIALPSELRYRCYCGCKYRTIFILSKTFVKKNQFVSLPLEINNMLLAVDVGNTRIKVAVFEHNTLLFHLIFPAEQAVENFKIIFQRYTKIDSVMLSSVGKDLKIDFKQFPSVLSVHIICSDNMFPFVNKYSTPKTVGIDRLVLAAGATLLFPAANRLVIDIGTCVTYDFIDAQNQYWGGAISPGLRLRYESLHQFTTKLPLLTKEEPIHFIGNSTNQSIHSGVVNGLIYEIDGFIDQYKKGSENFTIILTGGDADFLAKRLKNTIFANSNFLLESLNQFFQYKINND